jgi:hypothetical protein
LDSRNVIGIYLRLQSVRQVDVTENGVNTKDSLPKRTAKVITQISAETKQTKSVLLAQNLVKVLVEFAVFGVARRFIRVIRVILHGVVEFVRDRIVVFRKKLAAWANLVKQRVP